jgi:hypothetical protein
MVRHYQPVAFLEVIGSAADSLFSYGGTGFPVGASIRDGGDDTYFDVRIWEFTDFILDPAFGYQHCKMVGVNAAKRQAPVLPSKISSLAGSACAPTTNLMQLALNKINNAINLCFTPRLVYDSTIDVGWDTGCRDLAQAATFGPACAAINAGGSLTSSLASGLTNSLGTTCVGSWGSVFPRSQAYNHTDPNVGSAMAAYRAVSLAYDMSLFEFNPLASQVKMQQVSPNYTLGFKPGSIAADASLRCPASITGRYGYVYWVPVSGCKSYREIYGLCTPEGCF